MAPAPQRFAWLKLLMGWVGVIVLIYVIAGVATAQDVDKKECPYKTVGNTNSSLKMEYFGTPSCVFCKLYEPVLDKLQEEEGDKFAVEYYDTRYCLEAAQKYAVMATPTTVFSVVGGTSQIVRGYLDEVGLRQKFCELIGLCV